jgi:hypothetical protein
MEQNTDDEVNKQILKFLQKFEKDYDICLIFVSESASRAHSIEVSDSDYDLKGIYLSNPKDSLKVCPTIEKVFKIPHFKVTINQVDYDVDVEFIDWKELAWEKVRANNISYDYCLYSPKVYLNRYPHVIQKFKERLVPSPNEFIYKYVNLLEFCEKSLGKSTECMHKKLLAALVSGVQYFHVCAYKAFPEYNVWNEIEFLRKDSKRLIEEKVINENEWELFNRVFDLIDFHYEEKKKGRKSVANVISEYQFKFLKWLREKYRIQKNIPNVFDFDFFQSLQDYMIENGLFNFFNEK